MKITFEVKALFLSLAITGFSYSSERTFTDRQADIYLRDVGGMNKKVKSVHNVVRRLPKQDLDRILIINYGGASDIVVPGQPIILQVNGHGRVDFVPWFNTVEGQQKECFISTLQYVKQLRSLEKNSL